MKTVVDEVLRAEAVSYAFRYRCRDCAHFDEETGSCAEGFPNAVHRDQWLEEHDEIEFCKSFELG